MAKKGNTVELRAASSEIQDGFVRLQSKLRAIEALIDLADETAGHADRDIGAATMLLLDVNEGVEALQERVVRALHTPVLQAALATAPHRRREGCLPRSSRASLPITFSRSDDV